MRRMAGASLALIGFAACAGHDAGTTGGAGIAARTTSAPAARALFYFDGWVDARSGEMSVVYRAASGAVATQATLPYGTGASQVYLHTLPGSVTYGCGSSQAALCGQVEVVNGYSTDVSGVSAVIDSTAPTTVSAVGAPYAYGTVSANGASSAILWRFDDPTADNFTFSGHVEGTVATPATGLSSTPSSYDFGGVTIYSTAQPTQTFTIKNNDATSSGTLTAVLGGTSTSFSLVQNLCDQKTLAPGGTCDMTVQFNTSNGGFPTSPGVGTKSSSLSVTDATKPSSGVTVMLAGTLTCGGAGNQCMTNSDCCSGSCNLPTSPFCN